MMSERGKLRRIEWVTRQMAQAEPRALFAFGDNMMRRGFGGQAKELRGEPNAVGVPTKWAPGRRPTDYFEPWDWTRRDVYHEVSQAFARMEEALKEGRDVVIPANGLGTGLSELPTRCPKLYEYIEARIAALAELSK
jgi:hypothetical protein